MDFAKTNSKKMPPKVGDLCFAKIRGFVEWPMSLRLMMIKDSLG